MRFVARQRSALQNGDKLIGYYAVERAARADCRVLKHNRIFDFSALSHLYAAEQYRVAGLAFVTVAPSPILHGALSRTFV